MDNLGEFGATTVGEISSVDRKYLEQCVEFASDALDAGDEPFGSLIINAKGVMLFSDRNRVAGGDHTRHPEFEIARWAANNLTPEQRAEATVYTSGEHCPMCSAAHAWVGLGKIVYASSSAQLTAWLAEWEVPAGPVAPLPIQTVAPNIEVAGPDEELSARVKSLHARLHGVEV